MTLTVALKVLDPRLGTTWPMPQPATPAAAGWDLRACIDAPITLQPQGKGLIPAGFAIHMREPTMAATILPRSGLGHRHGLVLGNGTGLIDADYQGPIQVSLWNYSQEAYTIEPGERIAQLVFVPILRPTLETVTTFDPSERGNGGFGSTGNQ